LRAPSISEETNLPANNEFQTVDPAAIAAYLNKHINADGKKAPLVMLGVRSDRFALRITAPSAILAAHPAGIQQRREA